MKKKIIISAVIAALFTQSAATAKIKKASFDIPSQTLTADGTVESTKTPNAFTVRLFKPGTDELLLVDWREANGEYSFSYPLNSFADGIYRLFVTESDGNYDMKYMVMLSEAENSSFISDVNAAKTKDLMKQVFVNHSWILKGIGIVDDFKTAHPTEDIEDMLAGMLYGLNVSTADEILEAVIKAAAVSHINFAATETEFNELLDKYKAELGLSESKIYSNLYIPVKETEALKFMNKGFTTADGFINTFMETVVLDSINSIKNHADVSDIIFAASEYRTDLNISGYNSIASSSNKTAYVQKQVAEARMYSSTNDLVSVFNNAVLNAPADVVYVGGGNGGSGGGSSSSFFGDTSMVSVSTNNEQTVFDDLKDAAWAEESILYLYNKGIVSGIEKNVFNPNGLVTREQFAKMIVTAFDLYDENAVCNFDDMVAGAWYCSYVASAVNAGIVYGTGENTFGVGENITREDMAAIAYRAAGTLGEITDAESEKFADDEDISEYAKKAVYTLKANGIMNGKGNNEFEPKAYATRAEAAKMIHSLISR